MEWLSKVDLERLVGALESQHISTIKSFITRGWAVDRPLNGTNPLCLAGGQKAAYLLVEQGADLDACYSHLPPIVTQAASGNCEVVEYLIDAGANVDAKTRRDRARSITGGATALMKASTHGYLRIVKSLLSAGACIDATDECGHSAIFYALRWNQETVAKELLRGGAFLPADALTGPVRHGNLALLRLLLRKGANVDSVFCRAAGDRDWPHGETLLGHAVARTISRDYPTAIVKLLVEAGANVNRPSPFLLKQLSPIEIAYAIGRLDVAQVLKAAGARGDVGKALAGWTLDKAAYRGQLSIVEALIKAGVDVNAPGHQGKRPIEFARERGHAQIVEMLKRAGATG